MIKVTLWCDEERTAFSINGLDPLDIYIYIKKETEGRGGKGGIWSRPYNIEKKQFQVITDDVIEGNIGK